MTSQEYFEFKNLLLEQKELLKMMVPKKASVSYLAEATGKSRQAIRQFLLSNYVPEVDYWLEGGKMFVSQKTAVAILTRSSK
ncbi:MAG TPA: hypothetical protein CFH82_07005 [Sulfurospirillum sp. UBA12182]|jgi:hypothetical protein|nr:MAG TPA: hypothetical protein CFH82_07005 [Sulfurospirillum sp. UBA12182]